MALALIVWGLQDRSGQQLKGSPSRLLLASLATYGKKLNPPCVITPINIYGYTSTFKKSGHRKL